MIKEINQNNKTFYSTKTRVSSTIEVIFFFFLFTRLILMLIMILSKTKKNYTNQYVMIEFTWVQFTCAIAWPVDTSLILLQEIQQQWQQNRHLHNKLKFLTKNIWEIFSHPVPKSLSIHGMNRNKIYLILVFRNKNTGKKSKNCNIRCITSISKKIVFYMQSRFECAFHSVLNFIQFLNCLFIWIVNAFYTSVLAYLL